jgi:hypothetical protein
MRPAQPFDLVITPCEYLAIIMEFQNSKALVLVGNGLFTNPQASVIPASSSP